MSKCKSILIVEDDGDIAESLCEVLREATDHEPAVAHNGEEALKLIHVMDKPCLIFLDMMMPVMDGFTFLSKIKEVGMDGLSHVIIITAASKIDAHGRRVLRKPFDINALLHTVKDVCSDMPHAQAV